MDQKEAGRNLRYWVWGHNLKWPGQKQLCPHQQSYSWMFLVKKSLQKHKNTPWGQQWKFSKPREYSHITVPFPYQIGPLFPITSFSHLWLCPTPTLAGPKITAKSVGLSEGELRKQRQKFPHTPYPLLQNFSLKWTWAGEEKSKRLTKIPLPL